MLKEHGHTKESEAFSNELIELLEKYNDMPAIHVVAVLSQFTGQVAAYASVGDGYSESQIVETISRNSSNNYQETVLKLIKEHKDNCPSCADKKRRLN